ncbi:MAG: hypothetical protein ACRDCW_02685 [Sarcina sp.]
MAKINRNRRKRAEETDSDSFKTISRYGRRLYWSKRAEAYSIKCSSSHIMAMQYFPKRNIIAILFWNNTIYEYTYSSELFDMFAQMAAGTHSHSVGKTFWSLLRRQTTEYSGKINYKKV